MSTADFSLAAARPGWDIQSVKDSHVTVDLAERSGVTAAPGEGSWGTVRVEPARPTSTMVELATICAPVVEQFLQNLADAQRATAEAVKLQAQAHIHAQEQETKRCQLSVGALGRMIRFGFAVYGPVGLVAALALWKGEIELARTLITALLASFGTVLGLLLGLLQRWK